MQAGYLQYSVCVVLQGVIVAERVKKQSVCLYLWHQHNLDRVTGWL